MIMSNGSPCSYQWQFDDDDDVNDSLTLPAIVDDVDFESLFSTLGEKSRGDYSESRLKESGLNEYDVAKRANADYPKIKKKSFSHAKAWEVVKDFDKWQQLALLGEDTSKRKARTQTGSNDEGINFIDEDESFDIPNLNEDNTPPQSRRSKKSHTESSSLGDLEKTFAEYAISKQELLDKQKEQAERKREKDELQIQDLRKKSKARDWKIYTEPHEHITNTRLLKVVIQQKTEIADTYGWDKYWEEE